MLVFLVIVPTTVIPNVALAAGLAGAFANSLSGFILPTLCHMILFWKDASVLSKLLHGTVLLFGFVSMGVTSAYSILLIINTIAGNTTS